MLLKCSWYPNDGHIQTVVIVLPSLNPYRDIGPGNPPMSMIVIGLSLPLLRQRWRCLMHNVYWLPDGCCLWSRGSKYLEYNSSIRTKNQMNNQTKALNRWKRNRVNKSWTIKLAIDDTGTDWLSVLKKGWIVTVQYLQGLIIFVIAELAIATLFCSCVSSGGIRCRAAEFYVFPAGSLEVFWKNIGPHSTLCGLVPNFQSCISWIP
jgi:hypothetical protein